MAVYREKRGPMKLDCPHCGAGFEVADDRAPTAKVTCPECLEGFTVAEAGKSAAGDDVDDLGFDLDDLMSYSGAGSAISMGGGASTSDGLSAFGTNAGSDPFATNAGSTNFEGDPSHSESSFDQAVAEMSAIGFDEVDPEKTGEVSHLRDVDLTMIGTYHRTGRKLHHATDVVWTGRGGAARAKRPQLISKPKTGPQTAPPVVSRAEPSASPFEISEPPPVAEPVSAGESVFDDFPSLDPSLSAAAEPSISSFGAADSLNASFGAESLLGTNASAGGTEGLEELDFSSLLEDSLSSKSLFGQDSNPFVDVGITSESVAGPQDLASVIGSEPPLIEEPPKSTASYDSSAETNTFFVDAPSVGDDMSADAPGEGALDASSSLDIDIGSHVGPLPSSPTPSDTRSRAPISKADSKGKNKKKSKSKGKSSKGGSKAPLIILVVILLVGGAGVGGEMSGNGWFFMNLLDESPPPAARGGGPVADKPAPPPTQAGGAGGAAKPAPKAPGLQDMPSAYREAIAALEGQLKTAKDDAAKADLTDKLITLHLQYKYRWPGRTHRDEAMQGRLKALKGARKSQSFHAQFWDYFQTALDEGDAEKKKGALKQAEVALAKVNFTLLPPESNLLYKGLLFEARGQPADALPLIDLALEKNGNSQWATYEKARLQLASNKLDDADATLDALLGLNADHPDASVLKVKVAIARQTPESYTAGVLVADGLRTRMKAKEDAYGEYQANLLRARLFGLQNDLAKRLEALEAAAVYDPKDETLLLELADTDVRTGKPKKAAERLSKCDAKVCGSLRYFRTYIKVLVMGHQLPEAEKVAARAEAAHSNSPDILFAVGNVLEQRGKLRAAATKYKRVLELDQKHLEGYLRLAGIHRREKEYDEAIKVLDSAGKVFDGAGKDSEAALALQLERAELLVQRGRKDDARKVFAQIVQERPNSAQARLRLATLHVELGAAGKAVEEFEKLLRQGKSGSEVSLPFAEALIQSGKPDRAIEELKSYLETKQNDLEGLVKLGHAYVMKQRFEEAMAVLEHAVAINRNFAPAYYYAGLAEFGRQRQKARDVERRMRNGEPVRAENRPDFRKAIRALNNAKEKDPENLEYKRTLAEALTESGRQRDLQTALEQYDAIIQAYRKAARVGRPVAESAEVYFNRGLLASKLGRPRTEVVENFKNAIVLDSGRADFIARYGEELYRNQTKKKVGDLYVLEAKSYFQLVMEQHDKDHVRSNYYMGKITLREWDKQAGRKPYDALHKKATEYFQSVIRHNGALEFPEAYFNLGNIMRDRQITGLANEMYAKYLETYQRATGKQSPKLRYVRDLMRKR